MSNIQPLTTEKYLHQSMKQQLRAWRRAQNRKAVRDFVTFLFGVVLIGICFYLGQQLPTWLPAIRAFLIDSGWLGAV